MATTRDKKGDPGDAAARGKHRVRLSFGIGAKIFSSLIVLVCGFSLYFYFAWLPTDIAYHRAEALEQLGDTVDVMAADMSMRLEEGHLDDMARLLDRDLERNEDWKGLTDKSHKFRYAEIFSDGA